MQFSTEIMFLNFLLIALGLFALIKGSDFFIDSASFIAKKLKISDLIIGLTVVSIGTSLPEFATNLYSAIGGNSGIALGNVIGSNIANILLVLSISIILLKNVKLDKNFFFRDIISMMIFFIIFAFFVYIKILKKDCIDRLESSILVILGILYLFVLIKAGGKEIIKAEIPDNFDDKGFFVINSISKAIIFFFIGLAFIIIGTKLAIDNVVWIARSFNISESVIAATIVAVGTSLPEVAVSISGVKKEKSSIVIGNIIGSCIFNIAFVMGISSLVKPVFINKEVFIFFIPYLLLTGFILLLFLILSKLSLKIWHGIIMLFLYLFFIGSNLYLIIH